MTRGTPEQVDVAIVGAGPAGLVLAALLDRLAISTALIDPNKLVCQHPRASHIDDEVMRILQTIGLQDIEPRLSRQEGFNFYAPDGTEFLTWDITLGETAQGWQSAYQIFQPDLEAELRGKLAMNDTTTLLLGWRATEVVDEGGRVAVTVRNERSGDTADISAAFVVGCDGAHSMIRGKVMNELIDLHGTKQSVITDVVHLRPAAGLPRKAISIWCKDVPITHVPIVEPMSRFQFMLADGDDGAEYEDPRTIYELLSQFMEPDSYRIMRTDVYEWNAHLVSGWRRGRLLVCGDAGHLMPPMMAQGMCSGLRDVSNLAWKLARVVRNASDESLLDTYESERSPHVRKLITESARQGNLVATVGRGEELPPDLQPVDRSHGAIGPGLSDQRFLLSGELAPQARGPRGEHGDDVVGYRPAVILPPNRIVSQQRSQGWVEQGVHVVRDAGSAASEWMNRRGVDALLVRPDRYVFAGTNGDDELDAAVSLFAAMLRPAALV